ncbi:MAG TPA: NAD-dependent epimerase/dehydratase family protein [Anaerolineales bacterium]|nr:NAD-dependent epimerase/dehydratase family protein [Anaerolineales bacterium]
MAKYLVTGGAGFIGSHIVDSLIADGHSVRVIDNFSSGDPKNLEGLPVEMIRGDIRDEDLMNLAAKGIDFIFHEAAFVSVPLSMQNPKECFSVNQIGTETVLEAARKAKVKRVVLASSAAVYGDSDQMPLKENTTLYPLSPYAVSKRVTELYAELFTRSFGLEVTGLRYFNVYGPRQRPDSMYAAAVPIFTRRLLDGKAITIYGDGGQTRDLVHVNDIVRANRIASEHPHAAGRVFNVCTGSEVSINDLVDHLHVFFPNALPVEYKDQRQGDIYRSFGDPNFFQEKIGYTTKVGLSDGLKSVIDWMARAK